MATVVIELEGMLELAGQKPGARGVGQSAIGIRGCHAGGWLESIIVKALGIPMNREWAKDVGICKLRLEIERP